jgi:hypothetical protein
LFVMSGEVACQAVALCEGLETSLTVRRKGEEAKNERVRDSSTSVGMTMTPAR